MFGQKIVSLLQVNQILIIYLNIKLPFLLNFTQSSCEVGQKFSIKALNSVENQNPVKIHPGIKMDAVKNAVSRKGYLPKSTYIFLVYGTPPTLRINGSNRPSHSNKLEIQ